VTLIIDAAPLVALANVADPDHQAVRQILQGEPGELVLPAPVTAEVDYILRTRLGDAAASAFLSDLAAGAYRVECVDPDEYVAVKELDRKYAGLRLGLADASVVVLAARFKTRRILTFDQRHFRAVEPLQGGAFALLPADDPTLAP